MSNTQAVNEAVTEYRLALVKARADLEARVLEETLDARVALSKVLHDAHANGTPIAVLKALTKAHNNANVWYPIWDAYQPETPVDLRRSKGTAKNTSPVRQDAETPTTWYVTYEGTEYPMYDVTWDAAGRTISFDTERMLETAPDQLFGKVWSVLLNHFRAEHPVTET